MPKTPQDSLQADTVSEHWISEAARHKVGTVTSLRDIVKQIERMRVIYSVNDTSP